MLTLHRAVVSTPSLSVTPGVVVDRAVVRSGESHKAVAADQGITPAQWAQQRAGRGHLWLDTILTKSSDAFLGALLVEIAVARGLELQQTFALVRRAA